MRILFWTGKFWPDIGGTATFATRLLPVLKQRGYEILVVAAQSHPNQPLQDIFKDIPVNRFPFWDQNSYKQIDRLMLIKKRVADIKKNFSPDLIHLSSMNLSHFFHLETNHVHFSPVLVTLHGYNAAKARDSQFISSLEGKVLNSADWVTGVSRALMDKFRKVAPGIISRSTIIYNGLEHPYVLPKPLPRDPPTLLYVGRLVKEKGVDVAIAAFPRILERFPQARMLIAGDGPEGPLLDQQARSLGIRESVDFLGWVAPEEVFGLINTASVVVIPSRWEEPFGFVALEAGLMARPVVATRVGGLQEIIVHSKTGLLVPNEDKQELSEAIMVLLSNLSMAEHFGQTARCHVTKNFSLHESVDAYESLYQQLGNGFIGHPPRSLLKAHT